MKRLPAPPAPALTPDEQRIMDNFRTMDLRSKERYLVLMSITAEKYPHRARPALRLVPGGGT